MTAQTENSKAPEAPADSIAATNAAQSAAFDKGACAHPTRKSGDKQAGA